MKLLERVRDVAVRRHLARSTIECYQSWIVQFLCFSRCNGAWRRPGDLAAADVERFLTHLARGRRLSASSQNQATCAIVFLYNHVLGDELGPDYLGRFQAERSKRPVCIPTVLSPHEALAVIEAIKPGSMHRAMVELLYGTGLRRMECCTLRIRDLDFDRSQIIVRCGKGAKDRTVMMPQSLRGSLAERCRSVRRQHERDLSRGGGYVPLPDALANKVPYAQNDWRWQYVFASVTLRRDEAGRGYRWYSNPSVLDRTIRMATRRAGIAKRASVRTRSGTASPRTCWKRGTTCGRCRRCSAIQA
jgi:integrase